MTSFKSDSTVTSASYNMDINGYLAPVVYINPPMNVDDNVLHTLRLDQLNKIDNTSIGAGDKVSLVVTDTPTITTELHITHTPSVLTRIDLTPTICPYCKTPLVGDVTRIGHAQCISKSCSAQMYKNVKVMLAALGTNLPPIATGVVDNILNSHMFMLPTDIYRLELPDFSQEINPSDAKVLITAIHAVRGYVNIDRVIAAIDVPGWGMNEAQAFHSFFTKNNYKLDKLEMFFDASNYKLIPNIDWAPWNTFIQLPINREFVSQLVKIVTR